METAAGIVFDDPLEPPNPYLEQPRWIRLSTGSQREVFATEMIRDPFYHRDYDVDRNARNTVQDISPPDPPSRRQRQRQQQRFLLPPSSISFSVQVIQDTARATATQSFVNDTSIIIPKGTYQFPLPYGSSVVDFTCKIGDERTLCSRVKPKEVARDEFDHAVREGRTAGFVNQNTPEIFSTAVGNIPANTTVKVVISFIFFLKHNFAQSLSTTTLTVPTYIAPRYGNPGFGLRETGPHVDRSLSIRVDILARDEIVDIGSDTHEIVVERGTGGGRCQRWTDFVTGNMSPQSRSAVVRLLTDRACLDRDFVLFISTGPSSDSNHPHATLETHQYFAGHSVMMIEIPPGLMLRNQTPIENQEIIFLADRSGSMLTKIPGLKSAMEFFLRGLPSSASFNIWCFGSTHESLWATSKKYDDYTLRQALQYVSRFSNDLGGTDLLPALESIAGRRRRWHALDVVVLTDGEVWRLEETVEFVRTTREASNGAIRYFALGIGSAVSLDLVEGIAKAGGGYAEIIPVADSSGWEARVVAVLKAALNGHVASLSIKVQGVSMQNNTGSSIITPPTTQMSPGDLSTLSPFLRNRIFIMDERNRLNENSRITINTRYIDGQETNIPVPLNTLYRHDSTLHKFAARALLGDLERRESWIQRDMRILRNSSLEKSWTTKEGERLGCKWSLVSKWTSFVAIETTPEAGLEEYQPEESVWGSLDGTVPNIEQVDGDDLGLLRPRVQPPRVASGASRHHNGAGEQGDSGEDDGSTHLSSSSDSESDEDHHSTHGGDDQGGGGGGAGGAGANSRGSGAGSQSSPRRGMPPSRSSHSSTGVGENPPAVVSRAARGASASQASNDGIALEAITSRIPRTPRQAPSGFQRLLHRMRIGRQGARNDSALSEEHRSPRLTDYLDDAADNIRSCSQSNHSVSGTDITLSGHGNVSTFSTRNRSTKSTDRDGSATYPATHSAQNRVRVSQLESLYPEVLYSENPYIEQSSHSAPHSALYSAPHSGPYSTPHSGPYSGPYSAPHSDPYAALDSVFHEESPTRASRAGRTRQVSSPRSRPAVRPETVDEEDYSKKSYRTYDHTISTPMHNPRASSALLPTTAPPIRDEDVQKAEAFIRRIVQFQQSNGAFVFPTENDAKKYLRAEVFSIVERCLAESSSLRMAVTMVLVVLLEERFNNCKDLWLRMVEKAKDYIKNYEGAYFGVGGNYTRMENIREPVRKLVNLPLDEIDESSGSDERVVLETAPL